MTLTPLQTLDGETLLTPVLYVLAGLAFGAVSYLGKDHETLRPRQLAKTLLVYGIAGVIVYAQGGDLSEPAIIGATALAAPIADKALNFVLPPSSGGSLSRGTGATAQTEQTGRTKANQKKRK